MTSLLTIQARLEKAQAQNTVQAQALADIVEANDKRDMVYGVQAVTDFFQDLTGAERLVKKYLKKWNRYGAGNVVLQPTDFDEAKSRVYLAILEYNQQENDIPLWEETQSYFGIKSLQQYRKGDGAFQKMMRENRNVSIKIEFNQDYGKVGNETVNNSFSKTEEAVENRELQEMELEIILETILNKDQYDVLTLKIQGYEMAEIATTLGWKNEKTARRKYQEAKTILSFAYNIQ